MQLSANYLNHLDVYKQILATSVTDNLSMPDRRFAQRMLKAYHLGLHSMATSIWISAQGPDSFYLEWYYAGYIDWLLAYTSADLRLLHFLSFKIRCSTLQPGPTVTVGRNGGISP